MEKENLEDLMHEAEKAFSMAMEEQNKPVEDVMAMSICHHSRNSIRMYLMSFLMKKGIKPDGNASISELLRECTKYDKRFANLDVSEIDCRGTKATDNDEYCIQVDKVGSCFDAANAIKRLVY